MKYISAEEFLKQPYEIQNVFIDWWEPSIGDLFAWNYLDEKENDLHMLQCCISELVINLTKSNKGVKEGDRIPLLTEGQLRHFIEDRTKGFVDIVLDKKGYDIIVYDKNDIYYELRNFITQEFNILKCYWKVACEIAKEEVNK